jgi:hypothetical protein
MFLGLLGPYILLSTRKTKLKFERTWISDVIDFLMTFYCCKFTFKRYLAPNKLERKLIFCWNLGSRRRKKPDPDP